MSGNTRASYLKHGWCDVALLASGLGLGRLRILKGLVVNVSKKRLIGFVKKSVRTRVEPEKRFTFDYVTHWQSHPVLFPGVGTKVDDREPEANLSVTIEATLHRGHVKYFIPFRGKYHTGYKLYKQRPYRHRTNHVGYYYSFTPSAR